jgi:hypothetical protein
VAFAMGQHQSLGAQSVQARCGAHADDFHAGRGGVGSGARGAFCPPRAHPRRERGARNMAQGEMAQNVIQTELLLYTSWVRAGCTAPSSAWLALHASALSSPRRHASRAFHVMWTCSRVSAPRVPCHKNTLTVCIGMSSEHDRRGRCCCSAAPPPRRGNASRRAGPGGTSASASLSLASAACTRALASFSRSACLPRSSSSARSDSLLRR